MQDGTIMATKIELPALVRRKKAQSYKNFNVGVYCPVSTINRVTDFTKHGEEFKRITDHVKVGRVYLENFRGNQWCDKDQLIRARDYFASIGIDTAGGITTCAADGKKDGFVSLCYSDEEDRKKLKKAVIMNAEVFDELIFDDFYFVNCRCDKCIENKGDRTWSEFRLAQRKEVTENLVMKPAKETNPNINVIVKYPQWFEDFNECGYDLATDTDMFDSIYTGTETRNPTYCQQHLPKYLSYTTMRLYGSDHPGCNLGGWFDCFETSYNITSYLEQFYLTMFAKSPEAMLFCNASFMYDPQFKVYAAVVGKAMDDLDSYMDKLGNPVGVMAYHPSYGRGENNLHSYLGQCGIPMEPTLIYPENAKDVFLAESAVDDKDIVKKMKASLKNGANVIVTSGFVRRLGQTFEKEFARVIYSSRKAIVKDYCVSWSHGVSLGGKLAGAKEIMIPQLDYCTNDVWEMAGAYGTDNNFPIVLRWAYSNGNISVITIPDDMGDLYNYPVEVLDVIKDQFYQTTEIKISAPAGVQLFVYDNDTIIIRSDLPYVTLATLQLPDGKTKVTDLVTGRVLESTKKPVQAMEDVHNVITAELSCGINYVLKLS